MFGYEIPKNSYSDTMDDKIAQYRALVMQAKVANRDHQGNPSAEEAKLYKKAMDVCGEIMNLNLSQRAVYAKWKQQRDTCEEKVHQILDVLDPLPVVPKPQASTSAASDSEDADWMPHKESNADYSAEQSPRKAPQDGEAETKTPSGFTTKNATEDVPATEIEKWYKKKPEETFESLVGRDELEEELKKVINLTPYKRVQDRLNLDQVQSIFFYGPSGSGKSTVIKAFIHDLMTQNNYKFMHLRGTDIRDSLVGKAEKKVAVLFQEAIDNAPCIIFIDEIEGLFANRTASGVVGHEKNLTIAFMEAYDQLMESHKPVVFIGATNYPDQIDAAMRSRMTKKIEIGLPGQELRQQYFAKRLTGLRLEEGLTAEMMAAETDGYSFRSLEELTKEMLAEFGNRAVKENRQKDADGNEDVDATDRASAKAIEEGTVVITRAMFEEKKQWSEFKEKTSPSTEKSGADQ